MGWAGWATREPYGGGVGIARRQRANGGSDLPMARGLANEEKLNQRGRSRTGSTTRGFGSVDAGWA